MALAAATTGSVVANLRPQALSEIEIPLPDLATQHHIGAEMIRIEDGVSELDTVSEVSGEMLDTLRQGIAAGLYRTQSRQFDPSSK
jgi:restriction endonuclease S subunit